LFRTLLFSALVLTALNAGFFFTWSFMILQGLDTAAPDAAMAAMNAINNEIRSAWFAAVFFGAPLVTLLAAVLGLVSGRRGVALLVAAAFVALGATVALTATIHLPLNAGLMKEALISAPTAWPAYSETWVSANHLRFATSLAGLIAMLFAWRRA